ncbi:hypothetical protein [Roseateles noduli]|uniref:hypothetical protein n=1 Tax=Roseateles noduli TaxID=2052484 RepID=UPI003D65CE74
MLSSNQEHLVEKLFSERFGAFHLFRPQNYRQGFTSKEPCDLFWSNGRHVALFYLHDSAAPLAKQYRHNQQQQHRYVRLWHEGGRSNNHAFDLTGFNRFGDSCTLQYKDMESVLVISIITAPCAALPEAIKDRGCPTGMVTISEALLAYVASSGGTFLDLLALITGSIATNGAAEGQNALNGIIEAARLHLLVSWATSAPMRNGRDDGVTADLWKETSSHLHTYRLRSNGANGAAADAGDAFEKNSRDALSKVFGDLYLKDFQYISYAVAATFANAGYPTFPKWATSKITCGERDYQISVFMSGAVSVDKVMGSVLEHNTPNTTILGYMMIPGLPPIFSPQLITQARDGRYFIQSDRLLRALVAQIQKSEPG